MKDVNLDDINQLKRRVTLLEQEIQSIFDYFRDHYNYHNNGPQHPFGIAVNTDNKAEVDPRWNSGIQCQTCFMSLYQGMTCTREDCPCGLREEP